MYFVNGKYLEMICQEQSLMSEWLKSVIVPNWSAPASYGELAQGLILQPIRNEDLEWITISITFPVILLITFFCHSNIPCHHSNCNSKSLETLTSVDLLSWSRNQLWNCMHFRDSTDEQLWHVDIYIFSNYYNLQSVHFE